ncbi:MAG: TonB-dependent receptor [Chitinophagia bacterium]|nr:TonB-dependent receptor [Chitinophagia bacterium]
MVIRAGKTIRMNLAITKTFNADFDGDEMNLHCPASPETEAELRLLSSVTENLISCQSSKANIVIVQDALLGCYMMTLSDRPLMSKALFYQMTMSIPTVDIQRKIRLYHKIKGREVYDGRLLFSLILPDDFYFEGINQADPVQPKVMIKKGILMEGAINRKQINYAWRIQGTLKKGGNYAAPAYYLKNTGYEEADYSITWGIKHHIADLKAYYSQYAAKNGIFEGAHAGNLTDLYAAFNRPVPTAPSYFSYAIDRSYQQLNHQIAKLSITKHLPDNASLEATYSFQTDKRYEYDLSLPYTSDPNLLAQPQVAFQLNTQSVSLHCTQPTQNGLTGNFGIDASTQSNVFKGIRYLIPNFRNYTIGIYAIERYKYKKFSFEIGGRYDYRWLRVYLLNPSTLIPYHSTYEYKKPSISVGFTYLPQANWQITLHTGTAWRAPSVNEMYIHGIHFGDAKYQNGDSTLLSERTINTGIFTKYTAKKWNIYGEAYCNNIQNYIYEMPTLQPVVLVSGTYPAFRFTQHHAIIAGGEVAMELKPVKNVVLSAKASTVYGYNKTLSRYLIYMPADRAIATLQWNIHSLKALKDPYIELQGIAVAKQNRVPDSSDFVPPPPAYQLINLNIGGTIPLKNHYLQFDFGINNLLNTTFRDYLNRYRYYANDMGRNLSLKAKISF